jgi:hypothetical protein
MVETVPWWVIPITAGIFGLVSGLLGVYLGYSFARRIEHVKAMHQQSQIWNTEARKQVEAALAAANALERAHESGSPDVTQKFDHLSDAVSPSEWYAVNTCTGYLKSLKRRVPISSMAGWLDYGISRRRRET